MKKILKRQERVPDLEHRRDRGKDPLHEEGRSRLGRVCFRTLQLGQTGSVYTFTVCFVADVI